MSTLSLLIAHAQGPLLLGLLIARAQGPLLLGLLIAHAQGPLLKKKFEKHGCDKYLER